MSPVRNQGTGTHLEAALADGIVPGTQMNVKVSVLVKYLLISTKYIEPPRSVVK